MKIQDQVKLQVTMDEAKMIFRALGKLPFEEVYELIGDLNKQINDQANVHSPESDDSDFDQNETNYN